MNPRFTIGLAALAFGLFGYIFFVEWQPPNPAESLQNAAKLLPGFDPLKETSVKIVGTNKPTRAQRINQQWKLASPFSPAQATAIESLLRALAELNRQNEIPA